MEISVDFDDSIIEEKQTDFSRDMQFLMKWMNEDEATAKAAQPKMQDMTDETNTETE